MRSSRHCVSWSARDLAILAVDLAPGKQAAVARDHHSVVLGRPVFTGSAWCIEQILAEPAAARAGFAGLVLACEPARHRWEPLAVTARAKPIFDCGRSLAETGIAGVSGNLLNDLGGATRIRTIRPLATAPEWLTWPATGSVSGGSTPAEVSMSRTRRNHEPGTKASSPRDRASQAAAQVKPAAAELKPPARSTAAAARRRVHRTRAWAAPQVEHAGQVLQDRVAPKVSALLSAAARRLEPEKPRRRRWRKPAGVAMLAAAASAVAAVVRNRRKPEVTTSAADADEVTPAAEMRDGQGRTSTGAGAGVSRPVRTS